MIKNYKCPVCEQGEIEIVSERSGRPGFRDVDLYLSNKTCNCITYDCEAVCEAIMDAGDPRKKLNPTCEDCHEAVATIPYPVGIYKYVSICPNCFTKKMTELKKNYA
ncbi:hypothetical protein [Priestia megaterium]|uniref:hypothetical protein n=1 Tax=Priestia megaterium TaxID=1404 RepID=UPI0027A2D643|nr:hypothetical protein [Priestia megaterium]WDC90829.1 hypothetical protein PSR56_12555 [Priestia megaterium]